MSKIRYFLLAIVILASLLRLVGIIPDNAVLNRDEAALGYNAYLLQQTGRDEWGERWPLVLQSFGDYKLIGYPALLVGLFSVFEPSDFLVRLPSVVAGVGLVVLSFVVGQQFGLTKKWAAAFAALIAITPVFVFYSRFAYEANVALVYLVLLVQVLWSVKKTGPTVWQYVGVTGLVILSLLTYNTPLTVLPLVILFWAVTADLKLKSTLAVTAVFAIAYAAILLILIPVISQKSGVTIFTDEQNVYNANDYYAQFTNPILQPLLGNKVVFFTPIILNNLVHSFSASFLVQVQDIHPWHAIPGRGHIPGVVYLFGVVGALYAVIQGLVLIGTVIKASLGSGVLKVLSSVQTIFRAPIVQSTVLALIGLSSAVLTVDAPHTTRSLFFIYFFILTAVLCCRQLLQFVQPQFRKPVLSGLVVLVVIPVITWNVSLHTAYIETQQKLFRFGLQDALQQLPTDTPVAFLDREGYDYILVAWYRQVQPQQFFATIARLEPDRIGFRYGERLQNIHFIAAATDISAEEKVLMYWEKDTSEWILEEK